MARRNVWDQGCSAAKFKTGAEGKGFNGGRLRMWNGVQWQPTAPEFSTTNLADPSISSLKSCIHLPTISLTVYQLFLYCIPTTLQRYKGASGTTLGNKMIPTAYKLELEKSAGREIQALELGTAMGTDVGRIGATNSLKSSHETK